MRLLIIGTKLLQFSICARRIIAYYNKHVIYNDDNAAISKGLHSTTSRVVSD
jgi:hypothetical protein